jgi:NAD(P)-dependent dehydrogenase (short-subunit alcohol dehydrogenase family)
MPRTLIRLVQCILLDAVVACMMMSVAVEALSRPTVLVTGSTDGIGVTTAKRMAGKGYNVILHGRTQKRIERASATVRPWVEEHSSEDSRVFTLPPADLSTIVGSRQLAREVESLCQNEPDLRLTVLMNNAGVFADDRVITADGLELTFAVNVMAPFVITSLLLPTLLQQPKSRIVVASSISQCQSIRDWDDLHYERRPFSSHGAYSESKLLVAMLTMEMADRLQKDAKLGTDRITCNCLDPGTVNTKMLLAGWGRCGIDVEDALDQTYLCSSEEVADVTGRYFVYQSDRRASSSAYDPNERAKMWSILSDLAPDEAAMWNFDWIESVGV